MTLIFDRVGHHEQLRYQATKHDVQRGQISGSYSHPLSLRIIYENTTLKSSNLISVLQMDWKLRKTTNQDRGEGLPVEPVELVADQDGNRSLGAFGLFKGH